MTLPSSDSLTLRLPVGGEDVAAEDSDGDWRKAGKDRQRECGNV